jgi:hypothetical protein
MVKYMREIKRKSYQRTQRDKDKSEIVEKNLG